jgi:hypothetical protein
MVRSKKRFVINRIRANHSYTLAELADVSRVHHRTTQLWRKEGLPVLDDKAKPLLVMGYDAIKFLKERIRKRRHPLGPDEFYCPKCRCARSGRAGSVKIELTGRKLGRDAKQVIIRGRCILCDCQMILLSSNKKMAGWAQIGPHESEREGTLSGTEKPSVNTDIAR